MVINEQRIVLGRLFKKELEGGASGPVEGAMRSGPSTYRPNVDVLEMSHHLSERKLETALVTLSSGRLLGLVKLSEILDTAATLGHQHDG
ncbi:MAG: hypothetical protein ACR2MY_09845 [Candidatus Dormibacteria bacterium]